MKRKFLLSGLVLIGFAANSFAQENEESPKAKEEKKVVIKKSAKKKKGEKTTVVVDDDKVMIDGEPVEDLGDRDDKIRKEKRVTIMVDGDNVTINGKPVDQLSDKEIKVLRGRANRLGMVAPYMGNLRRLRTPVPPTPPDVASLGDDMDVLMELEDMQSHHNKALLGVTTEKDEKGAKITSISKESGAEKSGLQKGDIITKINDYKVGGSSDLVTAIGKHNPEDKVTVTYIRDGKTNTTTATLGKNDTEDKVFSWNNMDGLTREFSPERNGNKDFKLFFNNKPKIGLKVQDVEEGNGVKVLGVDENSPAAKAGLLKDDIVTEINGDVLKTVDDLREKTRSIKEGESYKVKYTRNGVAQTTEVKIPKKLKTADL